jgi:hypothetical protein
MKSNPKFTTGLLLALTILLLVFTLTSCEKYLDAKSDQTISTPSTITDLEGILDNYTIINARYPSAAEVASDSFYLVDADWASLAERQRYFYMWQKFDDIGSDYSSSYGAIASANIILETLPKVAGSDAARNNNIEGSAKFVRASYHFIVSQMFAKAYDATTAITDLGIALRLTSDPEQVSVRSTISETYKAIISDLQSAIALLPIVPKFKYKPGKPAAYGMLSRVYLSMRDYTRAGLYADSCLQLYSKLLDYNTISITSTTPFAQFNDEVIYDTRSSGQPAALANTKARIDTTLYLSYAANDLRKVIFFKSNTNGSKAFKGNYTGLTNATLFTGIATDELFLTKAECAVRNSNIPLALQTFNQLMVTRWKTGTYIPITMTDPAQLLSLILQERNKELLFRDLRWTDLRRLNKEPAFAKSIYRKLNGTLYELKPNDLRYVFEIDANVVNIGGQIQNP